MPLLPFVQRCPSIGVLNSPDDTVLEGFDAFEIPEKNGILGGVSSLLWVPLTYEGTNDKNYFFFRFSVFTEGWLVK